MIARKQIKDFKIALKDMEPWVRNPKYLLNGRNIGNFSMRPREAWANWLLCVVLRKLRGDCITFAEDNNGDGLLIDKEKGLQIATEHVAALNFPSKKKNLVGEARIIEAINKKIARGPEYAKNKILIVFFEGAGQWYRNKVREAINWEHGFLMIYSIGLLTVDNNGYAYSVTEYHQYDSVTFKVQINPDFTDWYVQQI